MSLRRGSEQVRENKWCKRVFLPLSVCSTCPRLHWRSRRTSSSTWSPPSSSFCHTQTLTAFSQEVNRSSTIGRRAVPGRGLSSHKRPGPFYNRSLKWVSDYFCLPAQWKHCDSFLPFIQSILSRIRPLTFKRKALCKSINTTWMFIISSSESSQFYKSRHLTVCIFFAQRLVLSDWMASFCEPDSSQVHQIF